jgi:DNA-binding NtrC family response regulator
MINVYPVRVQAYDAETDDVLFTMETFDAHAAQVVMHTTIGPGNVDELTAALRRAVVMLELE